MTIKTANAASSILTAFSKPLIEQRKKVKSVFEYNENRPLTQEEKKRRHLIFKHFVSLMRGERLERECEDFVQYICDLPQLSRSNEFGTFTVEEIYKLGVIRAPSYVQNIFICQELNKRFGDLSVADCFYKSENLWRLDVNRYLAASGLLMPVREYSSGLIEYLLAYRHVNDKSPFRLQTRVGGLNA